MSVTVSISPWLIVVLVAVFIALRVYHPVTSFVRKRKK